MICIVALVVSGILAIFSSTHRRIAARAFDCVFRKITLRPCTSGLDEELKAQITGPILRANPRIGRHVLRRFQVYSWILAILTIASLAGIAYGGINFYLYGNCNGRAGGFCLLDPAAGSVSALSTSCAVPAGAPETPTEFLAQLPAFPELSTGNGTRIVEFGCYACPYTRESESAAAQLRSTQPVRFTFLPVTIPSHPYSIELQTAALCAAEEGRFWEVHDYLMSHDPSNATVEAMVTDLSLNASFTDCLTSNSTAALAAEIEQLAAVGNVKGTPTFITAKETLAGPQKLRVLRRVVR